LALFDLNFDSAQNFRKGKDYVSGRELTMQLSLSLCEKLRQKHRFLVYHVYLQFCVDCSRIYAIEENSLAV